MKFELENYGPVRKATLELGDLTIICGRNNTGKTCIAYAIYDFIKSLPGKISFNKVKVFNFSDQDSCSFDLNRLLPHVLESIQNACESFAKKYMQGATFALKEVAFETSFNMIKDEIWRMQETPFIVNKEQNIISIRRKEPLIEQAASMVQETPSGVSIETFARSFAKMCFVSPRFQPKLFGNFFAITTERTGVSVFRKIINIGNLKIVQGLQEGIQGKTSPGRYTITADDSYSEAVQDNLEYVNKLEDICKRKSFLMHKQYSHIQDLLQELVCGTFEILPNDVINFVPKAGNDLKLSMKKSSSSVRALLLLDCYLRYTANKGDTLLIDEPELNLHPESQRKLARLLAMLVNAGLKVFITTHSDYFIREFNTLIQLHRDKPHLREIQEKEGYVNQELLSAKRVSAYSAVQEQDGITFQKAPVSQESGISIDSLDEVINKMNEIQDAIIWG